MGTKRSRGDSLSSSEDTSTPYSREQSVDIKIVHLDADSAPSHQPAVMKCSLPPHEPIDFSTFDDYDVHYRKTHLNRCCECQRNFPDEHFLHLHIAEYHDPINAARRERGEQTYACLVPNCDRLCSTPQKRRLHCIDKHQFPKNYNFIIIKDGIDRRTSMLLSPHRRRSSTMSSVNTATTDTGTGRRRGESTASTAVDSMDVAEDGEKEHETQRDSGEVEMQDVESKRYPAKLRGRGGFSHGRGSGRVSGDYASTVTQPSQPAPATASPPKDPMDILTSSMSALQFVPHSVRVARGRGRGRGG